MDPKECERLGTYVRRTDQLALEQCEEMDKFRQELERLSRPHITDNPEGVSSVSELSPTPSTGFYEWAAQTSWLSERAPTEPKQSESYESSPQTQASELETQSDSVYEEF